MSQILKRKYRRIAKRIEKALVIAWPAVRESGDAKVKAWAEEGERIFNLYADKRDAESAE